MKLEQYLDLQAEVFKLGFKKDWEWSQNVKFCNDPLDFWVQYTFVICNSGMKAQIATVIFDKIMASYRAGNDAAYVFGHKAKAKAINQMHWECYEIFDQYNKSLDKLEYLESLPWIGPITKYHLAKNLGHDCAKPDRHLARIAGDEGTHAMCKRLSDESGDRIATVDVIIWRAANQGLI